MTLKAANQDEDPNAVRKSILVAAPQATAFRTFTETMSVWWPPDKRIGKAAMKEALMEQRVGGRWFERGVDGTECEWGRVLVWEPPRRLVLDWQLSAKWQHDPSLHTEVEVRFISEGPDRTRVELEHRNLDRYGQTREAVRKAIDGPNGWPSILDSYSRATAR